MEQIIDLLTRYFAKEIRYEEALRGDGVIHVLNPDRIATVMELLRDNGFSMLVDVTAVHYPDRDAEFEVIYNLLGIESRLRLLVKVCISGGEGPPTVDSVTHLFKSANWHEREVFDMFGIRFRNHPNMKRILMWETYEGHPLRKDFPLEGDNLHCHD